MRGWGLRFGFGFVRSSTNGVQVSAPPALGYTPAFAVSRNGAGIYSHNFDVIAVRPTVTHTVYCGAGGSNAADGLTWANRVRSLKQAMVLAGALGTQGVSKVRILAQAGEYKYSSVDGGGIQDSFAKQTSSRDMVIEPCDASGNPVATGKIVSINDQVMPSFSLVSGSVYVSTYTTEIPGNVVCDRTNLNAKANPQALRPVTGTFANEAAIVTAVNTMWTQYGHGASYLDTTNKKLYVRLFDNRAPDTSLVVFRTDENFYLTGYFTGAPTTYSPQTLWMRNVSLWGGLCFKAFLYAPQGNAAVVYRADCETLYGYINGYSIDGTCVSYSVRCLSADSFGDGSNYDTSAPAVGAPQSVAIELDCASDWCGNNDNTGDASANASSCHVSWIAVRVNHAANRTQNRAFHDIKDAKSWNLGCIASDCRQTGVQSGAFAAGFPPSTGETATVWLDGCSSVNNAFDLEAYKGGVLYYANMNTAGYVNDTATGGTILAYNSPPILPGATGTLSAAALSSSTVQLTFAAGTGATSYQYRVGGGTALALAGDKIVTGLNPSTAYSFEVRSVNLDGASAWSNVASTTTPASASPVETLTNGAMSASTTWDKLFGGWSISGGLMRLAAVGAFNDSGQAVAVTAGKYYELVYTISSYSAGSIQPRLEGTTTAGFTTRSANGTFTERVLANTGNNRFSFITTAGPATMNIDNVSLIGPYDTSTVGGA